MYMCVCVPGVVPCPAAAVAIAKAEAGETEQREFSPDWTADAHILSSSMATMLLYFFFCC